MKTPRTARALGKGKTKQCGIAPSFETNFNEPHVAHNFWGLDSLLIGLSDNLLYVSDNEGQTWSQRYAFDFSPNFQKEGRMHVAEGRIFVVSWPDKKIFVSTDKGYSFDTLVTPQSPGGSFIFRAHGNTFLLCLDDGFIYQSRDLGENWTKIQPPRAGFDLTSTMNYHTTKDSMIFLMDNANGQVWRINVERLAKITGKVFLDYDADGLQDSIEPGVKDMVVRARNSLQFFGVTDTEGNFSINIAHLADTLELATTLTHFIPEPTFQIVQATDTFSVIFALKPIAQVTDVAVNLVATTVFRPGFENILVATLSNNGVLPASGVFHLVLDSVTNLLDALPLPDWQSGDTLFWQYHDLLPLQKLNYQIRIETGTIVALGYVVHLSAEAASTLTDISPLDNIFNLEAAVVGSYDPNDKAVSPLNIPPLVALDGGQLTYTIRFQNTGTFPTAFVILRDTLSERLDLGSVRMLAASHPFTWGIHGRELTFRFDPLLLPPAQDDEIGSHGFVQFSVEMKPGAMLGDIVRNTAQIYFDYNLPIVTNTVETIVKEAVSSYSLPDDVPTLLRAYPNPTRGEVWLDWSKSKTKPSWIRLLTAQGVEVLSMNVAANDASVRRLDLSSLPRAFYFVVFEMPSGKKLAIKIELI
ncbi:MAG: hypothetical protein H7246_06010 [Phycisphaerae bacterium]|nr:hypothetical protein [Saprospiraceae bacterium]